MGKPHQILNAQTSNVSSPKMEAQGTTVTFFVTGTFGTASVYIQVSPDEGTTWITVTDLNFTAAAVKNFQIGRGVWYRVVVAGSGGGTSVSAWVSAEV